MSSAATTTGRWHARGPLKRAFDLAVASVLMVLGSPVMLALAVVIRLRLGSPVLFRDRRLGFRGRPFDLYKFRTMTDGRGPDGELLPDAERLVPLGVTLRRWSLDELPAFINVLRGEMSLVGPRPLPERYRDRFTPDQMRRHDVMPGVTGWAQVSGRNALDWPDRFDLDLWYVENRSLGLDLRILLRTVRLVLRGHGVSASGHVTMPEFGGQDPS